MGPAAEGRAYDPEYFQRRQATFDGRTYFLTQRVRSRSQKRKIPFDLDLTWVRERIAEIGHRCERTGREFVYESNKSPWQPSIDRIDSNGGYTRDNVQFVCLIYNLCKNDATDDDVLELARLVLKHKQSE